MRNDIDELPPLITRATFLRVTGLSNWTLNKMREAGAIRAWTPPGWTRKTLYFKCEVVALINPKTKTTTNGH